MTRARSGLPFLTAEQMLEVDRLMIEEYGIELIQMMESTGRGVAHLARERFLAGSPVDKKVVVLAGPGTNGGGAMAGARRLAGWGAEVRVFLTGQPDDLTPEAARQLASLRRLGIPVGSPHDVIEIAEMDMIVDGLMGYNVEGPATGPTADLIRWANEWQTQKLALDLPSGLDASDGHVGEPVIRATCTLALALPKEGLRQEDAKGTIGEVYLADIGVPPELYREPSLGIEVEVGPIFARADILKIR